MANEIKDVGAAFPSFGHDCGDQTGMTLRDWFAGQALVGILGPNYDWFTSGIGRESRTHEAAHFAYSLADAMLLAAREGGDA